MKDATAAKVFADHLLDLLTDSMEDFDESEHGIKDVVSFREAGVMTRDEGFVVELVDGRKLHITIQE